MGVKWRGEFISKLSFDELSKKAELLSLMVMEFIPKPSLTLNHENSAHLHTCTLLIVFSCSNDWDHLVSPWARRRRQCQVTVQSTTITTSNSSMVQKWSAFWRYKGKLENKKSNNWNKSQYTLFFGNVSLTKSRLSFADLE